MFTMTSNIGGRKIEVQIEVDNDEGPFLNLTTRDWDTGDDGIDLIATDPTEVEAFFDAVDRAREAWAKYTTSADA